MWIKLLLCVGNFCNVLLARSETFYGSTQTLYKLPWSNWDLLYTWIP